MNAIGNLTHLLVSAVVRLSPARLGGQVRWWIQARLRPTEREAVGRAMQRERNEGAMQLIRSWMAEDSAMTAEERQRAQTEWERIKADLDADRLSDRPLFP